MDDPERTALFNAHLPFARVVAASVLKHAGNLATFDELLSAAMEGLWGAAGSYRESVGTCFIKYCPKRIRGAIFDYLRQTVGTRRKYRPRVAAFSQIDGEGLDANMIADDRGAASSGDETDDWWKWLLLGLIPREKLALALVFRDGLAQKEAGRLMGINESRVSQIISDGLTKARKKLAFKRLDGAECFAVAVASKRS